MNTASLQIIGRLARPELRTYSVAFFLIFLTNLVEIGWIRYTALVVEDVAEKSATASSAIAIIALAAVIFLLRWTNRNVSFLAGRRIERRLRSSLFERTIGLTQEEMDHHRTGDLVSRIINDVTDIRLVLGSGFLQLSNNLVAYAVTFAAMIAIAPTLALAALVPFVPLFFVAKRLTAASHARAHQAQEALGSLSSSVEEAFGGAEIIKSYTAEEWQERRFENVNRKHYDAEVAAALPESLFISMMGSVVWLGIAAILLAAGFVVSRGGMLSVGDVATFIFLFVKLVWPTVALGWIMNVIQRGLAAAKRIMPVLTLPSGRSADKIPSGARIELHDVSYRYPTAGSPALSDINLRIDEGEWVGVVGPTAAGKTTLAKILAGLRTPTSGIATIGGVPVSEVGEDVLRGTVHLASQTPTLFSIDLRENLRLAGTRSDEEFSRVIEDVAFGDELSLMPEGINTRVGERGFLLSGGQRQRLSLARAFLAEPRVLVLDDILSAVDFATELKLLDGITKHRAGKTTVFITHRLAVLSRLSRIVVIEGGRITADGPLAFALNRSKWLAATFEAERLAASIA